MNRLIVVSEKGCIELYMYKEGNYDLKINWGQLTPTP